MYIMPRGMSSKRQQSVHSTEVTGIKVRPVSRADIQAAEPLYTFVVFLRIEFHVSKNRIPRSHSPEGCRPAIRPRFDHRGVLLLPRGRFGRHVGSVLRAPLATFHSKRCRISSINRAHATHILKYLRSKRHPKSDVEKRMCAGGKERGRERERGR